MNRWRLHALAALLVCTTLSCSGVRVQYRPSGLPSSRTATKAEKPPQTATIDGTGRVLEVSSGRIRFCGVQQFGKLIPFGSLGRGATQVLTAGLADTRCVGAEPWEIQLSRDDPNPPLYLSFPRSRVHRWPASKKQPRAAGIIAGRRPMVIIAAPNDEDLNLPPVDSGEDAVEPWAQKDTPLGSRTFEIDAGGNIHFTDDDTRRRVVVRVNAQTHYLKLPPDRLKLFDGKGDSLDDVAVRLLWFDGAPVAWIQLPQNYRDIFNGRASTE